MKSRHLAALAALALVAAPALTGCWNGQQATTYYQATMNTCNGVEAQQGAMHVENATLVLGPEGSTSATLTMRVVNVGPEADAITYLTINGTPVEISEPGVAADSGADIGPGESISFGFDSTRWINTYDLDVEPSSYVPVEIGFQNAGLLSIDVLTVP
ncbi:MAG: hypothetical protein ACKOYQ_14815, partial [Actinomycetota bacterium]